MKTTTLFSLFTAAALVFLCNSTVQASSLIIDDSAVASVYGAVNAPSRDQTRITTRYNSVGSQYELTGFIKLSLPELQQVLLTDAVLYLKTVNRAHANPAHSMVLGFTTDEFDPATLTLTTYDGTNPWTLGNNAGVNPGTANPPFPNVLVSITEVTATDTWYAFQSTELTQYLQQQFDSGKDAYLYITQGKGGTANEFVNFYGPGETTVANSTPYLQLTYQAIPEPNTLLLIGSIGTSFAFLRRRKK